MGEWKIWFQCFDKDGKHYGSGVYHRSYVRRGNAIRVARKIFGDEARFKWLVSKTNPWSKEVV